jgi:hypothetical protein
MAEQRPTTWCPSAPPNRAESVVLGVHVGRPEGLVYLGNPVPAADAVTEIPADVTPASVVRFAAHCDQACAHRLGRDCGLVSKVAAAAPSTEAHALPRCHLRPNCQWWVQVGPDACRRCPLVTTVVYQDDELMKRVSDPRLSTEDL